MMSQATVQETQRHTHSLHVFSGPMMSHGTCQKTGNMRLTVWKFSDPLISPASSEGNRQTNSHPGCVFGPPDE